MGSSCSSTREADPTKVPMPMDLQAARQQQATPSNQDPPPEPVIEPKAVVQPPQPAYDAGGQTGGEPSASHPATETHASSTTAPPPKRERDKKYLFDVKFKKRPLGIVLTSARNGRCAYVTQTSPKKQKKAKKIPIKSKLLKVNDADIENEKIDAITQRILRDMRNPPLVLSFCKPEGLGEDEFPDPNPREDFTKQRADN